MGVAHPPRPARRPREVGEAADRLRRLGDGDVARRRRGEGADEEAARGVGERAAQGVGDERLVGGGGAEPDQGRNEHEEHRAHKRHNGPWRARMAAVAEPRAEPLTTPTYGNQTMTVAPVARPSGPVADVQALLDLAVVMAERDRKSVV